MSSRRWERRIERMRKKKSWLRREMRSWNSRSNPDLVSYNMGMWEEEKRESEWEGESDILEGEAVS